MVDTGLGLGNEEADDAADAGRGVVPVRAVADAGLVVVAVERAVAGLAAGVCLAFSAASLLRMMERSTAPPLFIFSYSIASGNIPAGSRQILSAS